MLRKRCLVFSSKTDTVVDPQNAISKAHSWNSVWHVSHERLPVSNQFHSGTARGIWSSVYFVSLIKHICSKIYPDQKHTLLLCLAMPLYMQSGCFWSNQTWCGRQKMPCVWFMPNEWQYWKRTSTWPDEILNMIYHFSQWGDARQGHRRWLCEKCIFLFFWVIPNGTMSWFPTPWPCVIWTTGWWSSWACKTIIARPTFIISSGNSLEPPSEINFGGPSAFGAGKS